MADHSEHPIHLQRAKLCDTLESLSPAQYEAETMCAGWDAGDMAAHLLVREREPIAAAGIVLSPLSGLHDARMASRKKAGRDTLQQDLRSGPTIIWRLPFTRDIQVGEDWIHLQDIVRGGAASAEGVTLVSDDGTDDPAVAALLWQAVSRFAPMTLRGVDVDGVITLTDGTTSRTYKVGGSVARPAKGATADLTITAPVGELVLFVTGRSGATVDMRGPDELVEAVTASDRAF